MTPLLHTVCFDICTPFEPQGILALLDKVHGLNIPNPRVFALLDKVHGLNLNILVDYEHGCYLMLFVTF